MKKLLTAAAAAALSLCMALPVFAADTASPFSDVDVESEQGQAIVKMHSKGYLAGYSDGTFKPNGYVTRAELVRIINQVFGFTVDEKKPTNDFSDNANAEAWYYSDVRTAQQMGYISGFGDNSFRPKDNFTRQQACVVLSLLTNSPEAQTAVEITDPVAPWAEKYVDAAIANGLFKLEEGNTFRAAQNITRGELCVALAGFVKEDAAKTEGTTKVAAGTTEATTETATSKSSTSYSGGGGGGRSGSSSKTTTETTTAKTNSATTKEATTETTTAGSSSKTNTTKAATTTTKATTTTTTTTEATTEMTTAEVQVDAALLSSVKRTAKNINRYVVPNCSTDGEKQVATAIADAMTNYLSDTSYDVESAAAEAKQIYSSLSDAEKSELKKLIMTYCTTSDLIKLRDTFFPGLSA